MNEARRIILSELEGRLHYTFKDITLLNQALTHKSLRNENGTEGFEDNERMEFLGDAILSLIVSDYIFKTYPDSDEGVLTIIRSNIVGEIPLSSLARELNIGKYILLGRGEQSSGGADKNSILEDAMEAIMAAIYLDSSYQDTYRIIINILKERIDLEKDGGRFSGDYKGRLQTVVQGRIHQNPTYRLVEESGPDHDKVFEVEIMIGDKGYARGQGKSKKDAERVAAKALLDEIDAGGFSF